MRAPAIPLYQTARKNLGFTCFISCESLSHMRQRINATETRKQGNVTGNNRRCMPCHYRLRGIAPALSTNL